MTSRAALVVPACMPKICIPCLALAALCACDDGGASADPPLLALDAAEPDATTPDALLDAATFDALLDAAPPDAMVEPPPLEACARQAPVMADDRPPAVSWSAAHMLARAFGPHGDPAQVDDALAAALDDDAPAQAYADALGFVCHVASIPPTPLAPAAVTTVDGIAWVRPGTGVVDVPAEATAVVLDLRELPPAPTLHAALEAAAEAVLSVPIPRVYQARSYTGMPDQIFGQGALYRTRLESVIDDPWPAAAPERPLVVWIDATPAPATAALAGAIRLTRAGWLVGAPVFSHVAESAAFALDDGGLSVRDRTLRYAGRPWPDIIGADAAHLDALAGWSTAAPPAVEGAAERDAFAEYDATRAVPQAPATLGARRAMLLIAHGHLRRFFPYFEVVGDRIDERLVETYEAAADAPDDRKRTHDLLARLSEAIADGHAFLFDSIGGPTGQVPFWVDHLEDERPVVRRSDAPEITAGDVITHIEGRPVADWYAEELPRTSAATRGYALDLAARRYLAGRGPLRLTLEDLDGASRDVSVDRIRFDALPPSTPWLHPTGTLDAFDAPEIGYVNMGGDVEADSAALLGRLDALLDVVDGLVVDMRGYPATDQYQIALRLVGTEGMRSPIFEVPVWTGPDRVEDERTQYAGPDFGGPSRPGFAGPIALLVGPTSVSAAENFSSMLTPFEQVTVLGRTSAATNGNITGLWLPGRMGLSFTGMRVRFPDGARFHGVGIVPDIEIWPTAESLAASRDLALQAAIDHLRAIE